MRWNAEQQALRNKVFDSGPALSSAHIERDAAGAFAVEGWQRLCNIGLFGLPFAKQWGGQGQDLLTMMYVLEGLGQGCRDSGLSFSVSTHIVSSGIPLQRFGSDSLKQRYLPGICAGTTIGAHAVTEPQGGSDMLNMQMIAVLDGDDYVLNGLKSFVSNGPIADLFVVYARTGAAANPAGITAFLVERGTSGMTTGKPIATMGLRTAMLSELSFENVRVSQKQVIGTVGAGFLILDFVMKWEILCSFIINVGEMQHRLEKCIDYARSRIQFGTNIGSFQSISNKIVEMTIDVETSRKWLYDSAAKLVENGNVSIDLSICKLIVSESNVRSALAAVQIFGGIGYTTECGLEKEVRNAVSGTIYSGTSEIHRQKIAALLGLHRKAPTQAT